MATMSDIVDQARLDINDIATGTIVPRYPTSDLLKFANDGIAKAYVMRPDLRYGSYGTGTGTASDYTDLTTASSFPLDLEYRAAIVSYVVARNQSGDDAFANNAKADLGLKQYLSGLGLG